MRNVTSQSLGLAFFSSMFWMALPANGQEKGKEIFLIVEETDISMLPSSHQPFFQLWICNVWLG